jgi:hypothetical protein
MVLEDEELDKIFNEWIYIKRMVFDPKRGLHIQAEEEFWGQPKK